MNEDHLLLIVGICVGIVFGLLLIQIILCVNGTLVFKDPNEKAKEEKGPDQDECKPHEYV